MPSMAIKRRSSPFSTVSPADREGSLRPLQRRPGKLLKVSHCLRGDTGSCSVFDDQAPSLLRKGSCPGRHGLHEFPRFFRKGVTCPFDENGRDTVSEFSFQLAPLRFGLKWVLARLHFK
jgi:hypothetical protein